MKRSLRRGFTLIEMLVAMTLTLFVMTIMTQAFVAGLDTFSGLKAIGDMQQSLRGALTTLRADLIQDHFEGKRRLSDRSFQTDRPKQGYLMVRHCNAKVPAVYEGDDVDFLPSFRATDHVLAFTVKLRGNRKEDYLKSNDLPVFALPKTSPLGKPTVYWNLPLDAVFNPNPSPTNSPPAFSSQWAEVAYFLVQTGTTEDVGNPAAGGQPLFGLYRAQRLLVPSTLEANLSDTSPIKGADVKGTTPNASYPGFYAGISCNPGPAPDFQLQFNSPDDVADGFGSPITAGMARRPLPMHTAVFPQSLSNLPPRSALVAANVVSFHVQAFYVGQTDFDFVLPLNLPIAPIRLYETSLIGTNVLPSNASGENYVIQGFKISIRVFEPTRGFSRQISLVQDM